MAKKKIVPPKRGRGQPSKLGTHGNEILELLRDGLSLNVACDYVGISKQCVFGWLDRGEAESSGDYHEFFHQFKRARAQAQVDAVRRVKAGQPGWQGSAWWLERCFRHQYPRPTEGGTTTPMTPNAAPPEVAERSSAQPSALN